MKPLRILFMSGLLISAIACDKNEDVPAPSAPVGTANTVGTEAMGGFYNIHRFEQDGVENLEMKDQFLDLYKEGRATVHGRNYLYEGQWSYNEGKEFLEINIPGEAMQAVAVTSSSWVIAVNEPGMLILVSNEGGTQKKLELRQRNRTGGSGAGTGIR